jgi:adenine phosphoribosyltransferase
VEGRILVNEIKQLIRTIPDFPKPGILFRDITPLLANADGFGAVVRRLADRYRGKIDKVAAIEARGFIFGAAIAHAVGVGFVPIRKPGKLPHTSIGHEYELEYGSNRVEIHVDGVGAHIVECAFVIDLTEVGGRARLEQRGYQVHALCELTEAEL